MSASTPDLTIVIPAYNEAVRLPGSLEKIAEYLARSGVDRRVDVIVVDDGSLDGTAAAARETARRLQLTLDVIALPANRGKGHAVRTGALAARGAQVLISDADFSTPVGEWEKLAARGAPVAIGSRALDESLVRKRQPMFRQAMGKLFNRLVQALLVPGIRDTQCGFKLFSNDAAREVFRRASIDRFAYDVEALAIARRLGYEIAEVPVLWFDSPDSRVSLFGGAQAYLDLLRIRRSLARTTNRR